MSVRSPDQIREALRDWVPAERLHFHPDWPSATTSGGWDAHGQLNHWTAMSRSVSVAAQVRILRYGYSSLPGPLCFGSPTRDGHLWIIGWGNTNHAGAGDQQVWDAIRASRFDGSPVANDESVDGNQGLYGWECQFHPNDGIFPDEMLEVNMLGAAAVAEAHGWGPKEAAQSMADHYEWAARKWDREVQNLANRSRSMLERMLIDGPNGVGSEDGVSKKDVLEALESAEGQALIGRAVARADTVKVPPNVGSAASRKKNPHWNIDRALTFLMQRANQTRDEVRNSPEYVDELADIKATLAGISPIVDEVQALAEKITEPMGDDERARLANDIAAKVDGLRVDVNLSREDVENE